MYSPATRYDIKKRLNDIYTKTGGKEIKRRKRKKAILAVKWKQ